MNGFTKLFGSIITSSVWSEDDKTRIMWITMLATADANGHVSGSIPGMADIARMTLPQAEKAITKLCGPDPYSRTPDKQGARLTVADGGWIIVNHTKYRQRRDPEIRREQNRKAQESYRSKQKVSQSKPESAQAEAEAEAEAEFKKHSNDYSNCSNPDMAKARASLSLDLLRFAEDLDKSLKPNSKSQRQALLNLIQWIKFQIEEKLLSESVYQKILVIAKDSKSGRVPMALFFSRLDKEIGYRARAAKQKGGG